VQDWWVLHFGAIGSDRGGTWGVKYISKVVEDWVIGWGGDGEKELTEE